jgi:outer membrane protein
MRSLSLTKRASLKVASMLLLAAFAMPALAQDAPALKIAVIDMAGALFNSDRAKAVDAQIEQETAEDKQKLDSIQEQAQAINDRVTADAAVMSDEEKRKAQTDLQDLSVQYQTVGERVNALLEQRRQEFQQQHTQALIQAIQQVIEEGQYTLVIRAEAALHFDNAYNITARVTEKLNQIP